MIGRLKALLGARAAPRTEGGSEGGPQDGPQDGPKDGYGDEALRLASAALMVEAALMDGHMDDDERRTITRLLGEHFDLSREEAAELLEAGLEAATESHQLYGFARTIKDRFGPEDRVRMIEMLWEVACADGEIHHYESNLVRRVAGLLYVPDRDSGSARKRVLNRLHRPDAH